MRQAATCRRHGKGYSDECPDCNINSTIEIRGSGVASSIVPMPQMLDLERAIAVVGDTDPHQLAKYMSLNGASLGAASAGEHRPVARREERSFVTIRELRCLLCAREATPGQRQCRVCGGSLVAEEALAQ